MKIFKRVCAVLLAMAVLYTATPNIANASQATRDKINQLEKEKNETEKNLGDAKNVVNTLTGEQKALQKELNNLNSNLQDITDRITDLENQIAEKEQDIEETEEALQEAKSVEENQYESMKKRIQFMYEDSSTLYLEIMFSAHSFSDFITLNNYIDNLASYDRAKFEEFVETRKSIEELEAKLIAEREELQVLKDETEEEKKQILVVINKTSNNIKAYEGQIDEAEKIALSYEAQKKQQEEDLAKLQKQLEEEIRMSQLAQNSSRRDIKDVVFDEGDRYLLATLIYCEAGGEPYEGKVAVGAVVINRVLSSVYPNTVSGVIYQKNQFSPVGSGRLANYLAIGKANQDCYNAADAAMSGVTNVGNCVYFRTPIPGLTGIQIGNHIFY